MFASNNLSLEVLTGHIINENYNFSSFSSNLTTTFVIKIAFLPTNFVFEVPAFSHSSKR